MTELRYTTPAAANRFAGEFRTNENGIAIAQGYGAVFFNPADPAGTEYELWAGTMERIGRHAFDATLKSSYNVRACYNHDPNHLLGTSGSDTLKLWIDNIGLGYTIKLPDTPSGHEVAELLRTRRLCGSSFMFGVKKISRVRGSDGQPDLRIIEECELYEIGPVTFPAYDGSTAGLSSISANSLRMPAGFDEPWMERIRQLDRESIAADRALDLAQLRRSEEHERTMARMRQRQLDRDLLQIEN